MTRNYRVSINTTVSQETADSIQRLATDSGITNSRALDIIVSEWLEYKEIENGRVNSSKIYLETLARKVDLADKLVNKLLLKLKVAAMNK